MKMTRMLFWFGVACLACAMIIAAKAFAYDATYNFSQPSAELVSGWKAKASATKGGPYNLVVDCKKPAPKQDGSYDCIVPGLTFNPVYGVVSNYDSTGKEMATSTEASVTITAPAPTAPKIVVTVQTISYLSKYGNPIAKTTVKRTEVGADKLVKEGTSSYRNSRGEYVTNTVVVM